MELKIKDSLESIKIYGRYLSEFLLPDQIDILAKSLQKDIEQKFSLTDVSQQRELLHKLLQHISDEDELTGFRTHDQIIDDFYKFM